MYQLEIRCFGLWEGMLNPMMSSFNRQCRLPDSKVIRLALCSLPLNGDRRRLWFTNSLLPLHSAIFSCLWYFYFLQGDFWLTYRKLPPLPIILGTKIQSTLLAEHNPVSQSLLIVQLKRRMVNGKLVYDGIPSD